MRRTLLLSIVTALVFASDVKAQTFNLNTSDGIISGRINTQTPLGNLPEVDLTTPRGKIKGTWIGDITITLPSGEYKITVKK